jgi:hypothetical protein
MQCSGCGQELGDETICRNCPVEATPQAPADSTPEGETAQEIVAASIPIDDDSAPAADSSCEPCSVPSSESTEPPLTEAAEAAPPADQFTEKPGPVNLEGRLDVLKRLSKKLTSEMSDSVSSAGSERERQLAQALEASIIGSRVSAGRDLHMHVGSSAEAASPKIEDEKSLYDCTRNLPSRTVAHFHPAIDDVSAFVQRLREHRVLLISSAFIEHTLDAAYVVIRGLEVPVQVRYLSIQDAKNKNIEYGIQGLLERKRDIAGESIVLVDALSTLARTFPDSILVNPAWAASIKDELRDKGHFLVVIVDLDYAEQKNLTRESFPYWEVPFLRPFLEKHFPDQHAQLEGQIVEQQKLGRWEQNRIDFAQQVINYSRELPTIVNSGGPRDPESSAADLLKTSNQVEKTVLYAAAFFKEITAPEFGRVIDRLLGKRTMRVPAPARNRDGSLNTSVPAEVEVPRIQFWEEFKDGIFTRLLQETNTGTVTLHESSMREPLRRHFEKNHRFYLIDQFNALFESGIFFYPSLRMAEDTTRIAVEMAQLYPDEFNEGWIVGMVLRIRQHFISDLSGYSEDPMFQFLQSSQPAAVNLAFARVADVCRRMLESPQKAVVQNTIEHLIKSGFHEEVLWLIKQLRFSSELDELDWLKQLLHRADSRTRRLSYHYLSSYLRRLGRGVYDGLVKIEAWLPPADRESYSPSDTLIFRLLIQYCLETVDRFDPKSYGKWPSRYSLFAIKDEQTATAHMSLLARWLLHPGIEVTLSSLRIGGTQMTLIGALLAEWAFILLGANAADTAEASEYSAAFLFNALFRQFASRINLSQKLELLKFWNGLQRDLIMASGQFSVSKPMREELRWKAKLVRLLISEIKKASRPNNTDLVKSAGMTHSQPQA